MDKARAFRSCGKKILAVLRNYRDHALEMGQREPPSSTPVFFMKPTTAYVGNDQKIFIPPGCKELHHEVELGVVIGKRCKQVTIETALDHVAGYALALDMTARDFQNEAKAKSLPWFLSKGFDTSCPVSDFIDKEDIDDAQNLEFWCSVNGEMRQRGNTSLMIHPIDRLIQYISMYVTLEEGDLLLTGTPSGIGPVNHGDTIECGIAGKSVMRFQIE